MTMFNQNGKRARNDDEKDCAQSPEQKRTFGASLPFRTSPATKHTRLFSQIKRSAPIPLFTQTITPTDSEDEISPQGAPSNAFSFSEAPPRDALLLDLKPDRDTEMSMGSPSRPYTPRDLEPDSITLSPKASPFTLLPSTPSRLASSESADGGRLPTPIYGHFQQDTEKKPLGTLEVTPLQPTFDSEYGNHMRAHRLPTPISEDEAMDSFNGEDEVMVQSPGWRLRQPARFPPPITPQPAKRNKPMFSMGFRADCQMCTERVPGHYNHIFWN